MVEENSFRLWSGNYVNLILVTLFDNDLVNIKVQKIIQIHIKGCNKFVFGNDIISYNDCGCSSNNAFNLYVDWKSRK